MTDQGSDCVHEVVKGLGKGKVIEDKGEYI